MLSADIDTSPSTPQPWTPATLAGRVLLAQHDADEQRQLSQWLREAGLQVDTADNGPAAVEAAMARDYDLVLMAMQLPDMDGVAATALLTAAGCFTPVVALVAEAAGHDAAQRCRSAGCVDVLATPVHGPEPLHAIVARHLRPCVASDEDLMELELQALFGQFRHTLAERLAEIESAWRAGELELLSRLAHTLKGGAGSFGHADITLLCADIENALRDEDLAAVQHHCTALRAAVQAALQG